MESKKWFYFEAEDRHDTASYHFQASSGEEAEAKARILYGCHDPLYGEKLKLVDETIGYHQSEIKRLTELGEDDFDQYMRIHKSNIPEMMKVLQDWNSNNV